MCPTVWPTVWPSVSNSMATCVSTCVQLCGHLCGQACVQVCGQVVDCQTPYYVLQWVAVAMKRDVAVHHHRRQEEPPDIDQMYVLVIANMFSQILVFVSSCCNPIIYAPLSPLSVLLLRRSVASHCPRMSPELPCHCTVTFCVHHHLRTAQRQLSYVTIVLLFALLPITLVVQVEQSVRCVCVCVSGQ